MANTTPAGRVVILGAGPTGLGAAERLQELGHTDWLLCEQELEPGGLSRSFCDEAGFTWDIGGHVVFSHYPEFTALLDRVGQRFGWCRHEREAWVWLSDRWVPYPFQRNLHRLPPEQTQACLAGLRRAATSPASPPPANLAEFLQRSFGQELCDLFMRPYNRKVWAVPPETMDWHWVGDRVAPVEVAQLERQVARGEDDVAWGPNNTFRFPATGGTGAIWRGLAEELDRDHLRYGCRAEAVDLRAKRVRFADGSIEPFDWLISTLPLDRLCTLTGLGAPSVPAGALGHNTVTVVGVGLAGSAPETLRGKCWMYFPEPVFPFYRVTHFSHYSPANVPSADHWSLLAEIATAPGEAPRPGDAVAATVAGLAAAGLITGPSQVVSTWHCRAEHGYPQPLLGRDEILQALLPSLEAAGVLSRGRFGAWHYEVGNMDHSYMQGREAVGRILLREEEPTLTAPAKVNARRVDA